MRQADIGDGRSFRRPDRCDCGKVPYRSEAEALAAAERRGEETDTPFRAYKCPGTVRWHLATRGFHPRALKSRARIIAWHFSAHGVMTWDRLLIELGINPDYQEGRNQKAKVNKILRAFAELGLIRMDDPHPPYMSAADPEGLMRVMTVGMDEYARSRGFGLVRAPGGRGIRLREVPS